MKKYRTMLGIVALFTGLLFVSCATMQSGSKAQYKTITKWNNTHTKNFQLIIPADMPNFVEPPYEQTGIVPISPKMILIVFKNTNDPTNDGAVVGVLINSGMEIKVFGFMRVDKGEYTFYIYEELDDLPILVGEEEFNEHHKKMVELLKNEQVVK